jgi:hypothetical protein
MKYVDQYDDEDDGGVLDKRDLVQSLDHWVDHINAEQLRNAMSNSVMPRHCARRVSWWTTRCASFA